MTKANPVTTNPPAGRGGGLLFLVLVLGLTLLVLFHRSFAPGQALFSNDGPLAVQVAEPYQLPGAFLGIWNNLYWLGAHTGNFSPNITGVVLLLLGPYGYTNFHIVVSVLILGFCAWAFFRQLGFSALACVLGALAAALNMNFFSNAAWGLSSRPLSLAMIFLALTAVHSSFQGRPVLKTILAGLAIGLSISEGGDNGAIFSLFVAAYAFALTLFHRDKAQAWAGQALRGVGRVALMAVFAAVLATQTLNLFVDIAVKDVVGAQQDAQTKEAQWGFATQWSLPKMETLRVAIPGLYGYRMDTPGGGNYWGSVGQSPGWRPGGGGLARYSGAGECAGVLVLLVGAWALAQAWRRENSIFTPLERKQIWFWLGAAVVALLFAWGRHAPFYQFLYALPYFSTIRNPMKFMHPFHLCLMVLFGFGVQGLCRLYLAGAERTGQTLWGCLRQRWREGQTFEKRWFVASLVVVGVAVLSFLVYSASRGQLMAHLQQVGFGSGEAEAIARFSGGEVGRFVFWTVLSAGAVLAVMSGWFGGRRALWAGLLLGTILVVDLARANAPWIVYYDYEERYASNPVIDVLKEKPYEHRVAVMPFQSIPQLNTLQQFYHVEWLQHHFQYYNIQSIDVAQEPRMPADKEAYLNTFTADARRILRYWRLANVKYLIGLGVPQFVDAMNEQLAPDQGQPLQLRVPFTIRQETDGGLVVEQTPEGPFGLLELTNALPRARLYHHWEIETNQQAALQRLADPGFEPARTVVIGDTIDPAPPGNTNTTPGTVEITQYSPRHITLQVEATAPSVLLLNDRHHPSWEVRIDGEPAPLRRANFVMRGVEVPAGAHEVTFHFALAATTFYITLAAVIGGLLLCGYVLWTERRRR